MKNLETSKLFGIRKAAPATARSGAESGGTEKGVYPDVKRALLEAERKKAEAITILRRHTIR